MRKSRTYHTDLHVYDLINMTQELMASNNIHICNRYAAIIIILLSIIGDDNNNICDGTGSLFGSSINLRMLYGPSVVLCFVCCTACMSGFISVKSVNVTVPPKKVATLPVRLCY